MVFPDPTFTSNRMLSPPRLELGGEDHSTAHSLHSLRGQRPFVAVAGRLLLLVVEGNGDTLSGDHSNLCGISRG